MLYPIHYTISGQFKINNASSNAAIPAGALLTLTEVSGEAFVASATQADQVIGLAGDTFRLDQVATKHLGYSADIVVNAAGDTTRSDDRINDLYRQTLASGLMTVYSGVGTFKTTVYDATIPSSGGGKWTIGQKLYSNDAGEITNVASSGGHIIGHLVGLPSKFPSGVPGTDVNGSMSLGTFLTFTLNV